MPIAPTVKLNNGREMPIIGLGTYLSESGEVEKAVKVAIDTGYRHIDTAYFYGNEKEIGTAVREKIKDGTVKREELFIVTKLWINFQTYDLAIKMCRESLDSLGLEYIDLFLLHWPVGIKSTAHLWPQSKKDLEPEGSYLESWKGLEECVRRGYTKSIGISNFNSEQIEKLLAVAKIKPVCNQIEVNPNINQMKLIEFCKTRDIVVTAYTPLGRPGRGAEPRSSIYDKKILEIAKKYGKTGPQVVLRFLVQINTCPLPKSVTKERIIENFNIFDFKLTDEEMDYIKSLNTNERVCPFEPFVNHPEYPFHLEY